MSKDLSQRKKKGTDEWNTPKYLIEALGPFDLDPATPERQPWPTARRRYTQKDNGLIQPWSGFVWLNPPYSNIKPWLKRMAEHNNGIAVVPASTGCSAWAQYVYPAATGIAFVVRRIKYCDAEGVDAKFNSGFYSALLAYGNCAADRIRAALELGIVDAKWVAL